MTQKGLEQIQSAPEEMKRDGGRRAVTENAGASERILLNLRADLQHRSRDIYHRPVAIGDNSPWEGEREEKQAKSSLRWEKVKTAKV